MPVTVGAWEHPRGLSGIYSRMADQLYLSLWYPNFRTEALAPAVLGVLRQFSVIGAVPGEAPLVNAATVYPIDWSETPVYERIYDLEPGRKGVSEQLLEEETRLASPVLAVPAAFEQLHEDFGYEFEIAWLLWQPEGTDLDGNRDRSRDRSRDGSRSAGGPAAGQNGSDARQSGPDAGHSGPDTGQAGLDAVWAEQPARVLVTGFGPQFDEGTYEMSGQVRIAFGLDTPFLQEEVALDAEGAHYVRRNVARLVALVRAIEKNCGISSRLLWSESGESLAEKLIARLQQVN
jgi:hypothetical protein